MNAPFPHPCGGLTWTDPPLVVEDIWHNRGCDTDARTNPLDAVPKLKENYNILKDAFDLLGKTIEETGAEVLLGFSQGSFVIYEYLIKTRDPRIKRAVAFSGYPFARDSDSLENIESLDIELLNVAHEMDAIVPRSVAFSKAKIVKTMIHNNKGYTEPNMDNPREAHVLPTWAADAQKIAMFLCGKE